MSEKFEAARSSLEYLSNISIEQVNSKTVLKHLGKVVRGLSASKESEDSQWCSDTKLLDFADVFLKVYYAAERTKRVADHANTNTNTKANTNTNTNEDYTQETLSAALSALKHATLISVSFRKVFYTKSLALYLMNILARDFQDKHPDLTSKKQLDFTDADTCMLAILTTLLTEPRVGEQLQQHLGKEVAQRFFQCKLVETALSAFALSSYITTNVPGTGTGTGTGTGNELLVPDTVLYYLLDTLVNALTGRKVYLIASASLLRLQKLILCSDHFNQKVMKCKDFYVLDILSNILESPEPPNAANVQLYHHESLANTSSTETATATAAAAATHVCTTYLEKERAAATCWALLLSEQHFRRNTDEMLKHGSLVAALKSVADKPNKKLSDTARGVLWQLQRKQPQNTPADGEGASQKLLSRRSSAVPNLVAKPPTVPEPSEPDKATAAQDAVNVNVNVNDAAIEREDSTGSSASGDQTKSAEKLPKNNQKRTVMISCSSYCRPKLVHRINKSLQNAKIDTWIYNEKTDGDFYNAMPKAVEECVAVLVCYSHEYSNSDASHAELNYARLLKKPTVYVRLEKFTPFGWLGTFTAGIKYHDFATGGGELDDGDEGASYKTRVAKLVAELSILVGS